MTSFWQSSSVRLRAVEPEDAEHFFVLVHGDNEPSIRLHEKLGFVREGTLRRMVYTRRQYVDDIWFGMTTEEFRTLHTGAARA